MIQYLSFLLPQERFALQVNAKICLQNNFVMESNYRKQPTHNFFESLIYSCQYTTIKDISPFKTYQSSSRSAYTRWIQFRNLRRNQLQFRHRKAPRYMKRPMMHNYRSRRCHHGRPTTWKKVLPAWASLGSRGEMDRRACRNRLLLLYSAVRI